MCSTKVKFLQRLDEQLKCPICENVFVEPWQTSCGHRFCVKCLESLLRKSSCPKCPIDGKNIARYASFHDKCCEREVLNLQCCCRYEDRKCGWRGNFRHLQAHEDSCQYGDVLCKACSKVMQRRFLEGHKTNECINRAVQCTYCGGQVRFSDMKDHLEVCLKFPMDCKLHCGKKTILRDMMEEHMATQCPKMEVLCPFSPQGCDFKGKRETIHEHIRGNLKCHLDMMNQSSNEYRVITREIEDKVSRLETEKKALELELHNQNEELVAAKINIGTQLSKLSIIEKSICEQGRDMEKLLHNLKSVADKGNRDAVPFQMQEILNTIKQHEEEMATLKKKLASPRVVGQTKHANELYGDSFSTRACDRRLDRAEHQLNLHEIQLSEQDVQIQRLEAISYNGDYVWKIDHFGRRYDEAISGKTPSIYSPPFYVGRFGYKVCAHLYPGGDGDGKGTHMSMFLVIMRGEYDALLPWPFVQKVHFRLLDQDRIRDVIDAFRPDPNCVSFKRPTTDMNVASGFPTFVSHSELRQGGFVRDDAMFIKVTVDMANLQGDLAY